MKNFIKKLYPLFLGVMVITGSSQSVLASEESTTDRPEIIIGCDEYEPYNYLDENGELAGIDADLSEEAFRRMGYEPVHLLLKWTDKEEFLQEGVIDCIWASYSRNGREDEYLWSDPYMESWESVTVNEDSPIQTLAELDGKKIAALGGTRAEEILLEEEKFPQLSPKAIYSFQYMEECLSALRQGYTDAAVGDKLYIQNYIKNYPNRFRILEDNLETSELAVAFAKDGDQELVNRLNETLKEMKEDGTVDEILARYQEKNMTVEEKNSEK